MNHATHNAIVNFIWGIADDVLRDVYVRSKYRDVILPMTVLRRLDCLLEPSKDKVLDSHAFLLAQKIHEHGPALAKASGYVFYNTSRFTLRRLLDEPSNIRANFETYLDGFSKNVEVIIEKFKLRNEIGTLVGQNRLYPLIQKFLSPDVNLSPEPVRYADGSIRHEGLTNLGMGYVFEELVRRFNEENNEEAGEHFTPRDIVRLMVNLIFLPIKDQIRSGTYLVYDDACGSGGMLTEAENRLQQLARDTGHKVVIELYGQEVQGETFAICQSDMLIKGRDPAKIKNSSTLSDDGFPGLEFDFMLANPPYGKSWKVDAEALMEGKKKEIKDPRFLVEHPGLPPGEKLALIPRVSDGQLLFLVNMLGTTKLGSRIAIVHNGSALFTGDAGQGESNIRRWILENDWLEAIIGLPLDMFYNTGIATYVWVLTNRKPERRRGKVQLIDATNQYRKLRRNLGKKNCELAEEHIAAITQLFLDFKETPESKIFRNEDFGYQKITVERPLRLNFQVSPERLARLEAHQAFQTIAGRAAGAETSKRIQSELLVLLKDLDGSKVYRNRDEFRKVLEKLFKGFLKFSASFWKVLLEALSERDETADECRDADGKPEPDAELRDTENVPLTEKIEEYFAREVLPHVPDAWIDHQKTVRGYEISFTRYFYKYQPLRSLEEIRADILALEKETEGLLYKIVDEGEAER